MNENSRLVADDFELQNPENGVETEHDANRIDSVDLGDVEHDKDTNLSDQNNNFDACDENENENEADGDFPFQQENDSEGDVPSTREEKDETKSVSFQHGTFSSFVAHNCLQICRNPWFNRIFLLISLANNIIIVLHVDQRLLSETSSSRLDIAFASAYLIQTSIMVASGRFGSLMQESISNRLDLVATVCAWVQIAGRSRGIGLTLSSLRLVRLLHPLTRYRAFAVLDAILRTLNTGWGSVGIILALIVASILFLGVVGVYAYSGAFRRRCVWADSLELKVPEQWCTR